jgi:chemotaxis response regulator CheB
LRIAIVNDLAMAITSIRRVIEHDGAHSVAWVARDGLDAMARFAADEPDLVLLDLVMPHLDGVHTVFGQTNDIDAVLKLRNGSLINKVTILG